MHTLLLGMLLSPAGWGLDFVDIPYTIKGQETSYTALLLRDCRKCGKEEAWKTKFFWSENPEYNDGDRLRAALRTRRYSEVWFHSGGGTLQAGVEVGRVLRQFGMTVRVRPGAYCISSCTVAFMGGVLRYLDRGATYEVHSASAWAKGLGKRRDEILTHPEEELRRAAAEERTSALFTALQLFALFQNTLLVPLRQSGIREDDEYLFRYSRQIANSGQHTLQSAEELAAAAARIQREGESAAQDILMDIERRCMKQAIADLRSEQLGPRSEPALRMIEAMYSTAIKETAELTRATLVKMGYITPELETIP